MIKFDPYQVLGIERSATKEDIERAYRKLARKYHPDMSQEEDAVDRFNQATEAKEFLLDPNKRRAYDFKPFDVFSVFSQAPPAPVMKHGTIAGHDLEDVLRVSLFDRLLGRSLALHHNKFVRCSACTGHGADFSRCSECNGYGNIRTVQQGGYQTVINSASCDKCQGMGSVAVNQCEVCGGNGLVQQEIVDMVNLADLDSNGVLVVPGKGHVGPYEGAAGNLVVRVVVMYPAPQSLTEEARRHIEAIEAIVKEHE
jgi:molecular chaperone DnaJ